MTRRSLPLHDVVVVGGGVAGLAAVSRLDGHDVLLLEESDRLGGRMASIAQADGSIVNLGAHLLTGAPSEIATLAAASGLTTVAVPGIKSALWFGRRLYRCRRVEAYPFVLPLTARERVALIRTGLKIRARAEAWRRASRRRPAESWPAYRRRFAAFESGRTFADLLGRPPERIAAVFRTAARRSAGEATDITAGAALSIFGALWVGAASASVTNIEGGAGRLGAEWRRRLVERAVLGARVREVREYPDRVEITYTADGRDHRIAARQVIVTTPAPVTAEIVTAAPAAVTDELHGVTYGPFVCLGLVSEDLGATDWDDVYAISTPGLAFDMLFHHSNSMRTVGGRVPGRKSLMCYAGGDHGRALLATPDDEVRATFLADIERVLPQLRGKVREVVVRKWERGNCFATPGNQLREVIDWNGRAGARVRLAGDYFGVLGGTADAAAGSGHAAATHALAALAPVAAPVSVGARHV